MAALAVGTAAAAFALAAEPGPPVEQIGPHLYRIGATTLDAEARTLACPGRVNMAEGGPIELLACRPEGKTHESVFVLDVAALDVQVGLLLLDLNPGRNPAYDYPEESPPSLQPAGDLVRIAVEWDEEGTRRSAPAERFLYDVQADTVCQQADWAFLGSRFVGDRFGADVDGTLITTFHDPLAILELNLPTVNDDIYYHVNKALCPPVGTPVRLVIRAPRKEQEAGDGGSAQ